jgi:hypothetical protein
MPSTCEPQTCALTAAELVNEEVRAFMRARYGRSLHTDEAAECARILERPRRMDGAYFNTYIVSYQRVWASVPRPAQIVTEAR